MIFWDWTLILLVPAFLLGLYAQAKVSSNFKRYSQVMSSRGLTGTEAARLVLDGSGLYNVGIEVAGGRLSDHYDPRTRNLTLSPEVGNSSSLAAWEWLLTKPVMLCSTPRDMPRSGFGASWSRWPISAPT